MPRTAQRRIRVTPLALAACLALAAVPAGSATRTFAGPGSFWDVATNWTGGIVPGAADDAALGAFDTELRTSFSILSLAGTGRLTFSGSANLTLAAASSIGALTFNAGTLAGAGSLSVAGASSWTGGTMTGTGTTTFNGDLTLGGAASVRDVTGGRTVVFGGTTTWTNTFNSGGRIRTGSGATLRNNGAFTDNTAFDTAISNDFGGAPSTFVNAGSYTKGGAGTTTLGVVFNNTNSGAGTGVVAVNAGGLLLNGGGTANSGATFTSAAGTVLGFGGYTLEAGSSVNAVGLVRFSSGSNSTTNTVAGSFQTSAGLEFASGTTNFTGTVSSVGSTITATGGTANFNNSQAFVVSALNLSSGVLNFNNTGGVTTAQLNLSSGTLSGSSNVVVNGNTSSWTGSTMTGTGTTTFNGDLALGGTGSVRDVLAGRTVVFNGATTWTNTFNNGGRLRTGGGATLRNNGAWSDNTAFNTAIANDFGGAPSTFVNAGSYTKGGAGTTTITLVFDNTFSVGGTGVVNVNAGGLLLTGGGTANSGSTFSSAAGTTLGFGGYTLAAGSSVNAQGPVRFNSGSNSTTNTMAGSFQTSAGLEFESGTTNFTGTVSSVGSTITATGGTANFNNSQAFAVGAVNLSSGALNFNNTGGVTTAQASLTGGSLSGSSNVTITGVGSTWTGTSMSGSGTTTFSSDLTLGGGGSVRDVTGGRTVVFNGATTWTNTFNNGGRFRTGGGATLRNNGAWSDNTAFNTAISNDFGGAASSFINAGSYTKGGAGITTITLVFDNTFSAGGTGVVNVNAGGLLLTGGGTANSGSTFTSAAGTTLGFGGYTLAAGSSVNALGLVRFNSGSNSTANTVAGSFQTSAGLEFESGTTNFTGTVSSVGSTITATGGTANFNNSQAFAVSALNLSSGTLNFNNTGGVTTAQASLTGGSLSGSSSVTITGVGSTWTGTSMSGSGTTTFSSDLTLGGGGSVRDVTGGRTVVFNGATTWTNTFNGGGRFRTGGGVTLRNNGAWNDNTAFDSSIANDFGGAPSTFVNAGSYTKGGAGTTTIGVAFDNTSSGAGTGVVDINAGRLVFSGGGSSNGRIQGAGELGFAGGSTFTLDAASVVDVGTASFTGGTTNVGGSWNVAGTTTVTAGTANFTGTVVNTTGPLVVSGGAANFSATSATFSTLTFTGGSVGGTQNVLFTGASSWAGGTMTGTGTTTFNGDLALGGTASVRDVLAGRTVAFNGTTTWTNTFDSGGRFRTGSGVTLRNTGTFNDNTAFNSGFSNDFGGAQSTFRNQGSYVKAGAGTTSFGIDVQNEAGATISVVGGSLLSQANFTNAGTLSLAAGRAFIVAAGSTTLGGTIDAPATSLLRVDGGTLVNTVARNVDGTLEVRGGTATMSAALGVGSVTLTAGTINGAASLDVAGASSWTSSSMTGTGTTNFNGELSLGGAGSVRDVTGGRTVAFNGTTTWTNTFNSGGRFRTGSGATLRNTGTFNDNTAFDTQIGNDFGGAQSTFINSASYRKSGAGTTSISINVTNDGEIEVGAGRLALSGVAGSFTNFAGTTLTGGTVTVRSNATLAFTGANIVNNASRITLDGVGSAILNQTNNANALANFANNTASGEFTLLNGRNFTSAAAFANSGIVTVGAGSTFIATGVLTNNAAGSLVLAGGSLGATSTTNAGTLRGQGSVAGPVANSGAIVAQGGTLAFAAAVSGTGSVTLDPGASLSMAVAGSAGSLAHNGSLLTLGGDLVVGLDYTNAGFGSGNNFDRRAGVVGAGQLLGNNVAWGLTGEVSGAGPNAWTVNFGTVRGGTVATRSFQVANTGTGASLRGALKNDGSALAGIDDTRLSGSGVVAANFGPVAAGGNQAYSVTFDGTGSGGTLAGQSVALVGNFDNLPTQTVALTGFSTVLAQGSLAPAGPVDLGNFRVGRPPVVNSLFTASNLTSGAGAESLAIVSASASGNYSASNLLGAGLVAPGASFANAVQVSSSGGVAGANAGSLTVQFASNGQAFDPGFVNQNVNSQVVSLVARGYEVAQPALPAAPVNVGNFRVTTGASSNFAVVNTNIAPAGFQELLNAELGSNTPGVVFAGSIVGLAPGASSSAMSIGFAAGGSGGVRNGNATLNLASDGAGTSGLGVLSLGSGNVAVTGTAFDIAIGQASPAPVSVGNQRLGGVGGGVASVALTVSNQAAAGAFSEALNASFASVSGDARGNGGSIGDLAAGASNGSAMVVTVDNSVAGARSGSVTLQYQTDGSGANGNSGLAAIGAGSQVISVSGSVFRLASASSVAPAGPIVFANQRVGGTLSQTLSLTNTAAADGFSEGLNATASAGGAATASGSFTLLAAGATSNTLTVGLDTSAAGARAGTVTLNLASDGTGSSGFSAFGIGQQQVAISGDVFRLAVPQVDTTPIVLAARVGGTAPSASVQVRNVGPDSFTERLDANWASGPAGFNRNGVVTGLAPGQSSTALTLTLSTTTSGTFQGNAQVSLVSSGAGTTGAADASLGSVPVAVTGRVWAPAVAAAPASVDFGIVRVGDAGVQRNVAVSNTNSGALTDTLDATLGNAGGRFTSGGSFSGLASGQTNNSALTVSLDTTAAGVFSGSAALGYQTVNPDLGAEALPGGTVSFNATVNNLADSSLALLTGNATLGGGGLVAPNLRRYTLTFADIVQGSGAAVATLQLLNPVAAPGDTLLGGWDLAGLAGGAFTVAGFGNVSLVPGQGDGSLSVSLADAALGAFDRSIVLDAVSFNGVGADLALASVELRLVGNVAAIPEPGTYAMMLMGLLALAAVARRRQAALRRGAAGRLG